MTQLFLTYISVALAVSVLIVVLVLVRPLLQKCYRARLLGWLWLVLAASTASPGAAVFPKCGSGGRSLSCRPCPESAPHVAA